MKSHRSAVLLIVGIFATTVIAGCAERLPSQVDTSALTWEEKLDQNGGVAVFRLANDPSRVAVRFSKIAAKDAVSGRVTLMSWDEAGKRLKDEDPAVLVSVWRTVPASRTFDRELGREMPGDGEFRTEFKRSPGIFGDDPPPPIIPCGCRCSCCETWGCLKVCC